MNLLFVFLNAFSGSIFNYNYEDLNIEISCCLQSPCNAPFTYEIIDNIIWVNNECFNNSNLDSFGASNIFFEINAYNDINQDGVWDISDIVILVAYIVNQDSPDNVQLSNGDINYDQMLDILDVILLVNIILGN